MTNRFGWKQGCGVGVSLHQQEKPAAQCHFDILQQLKAVTVPDSKTSLREVSSLPGRRGCYQLQGSEGEDGRHLVCNYC